VIDAWAAIRTISSIVAVIGLLGVLAWALRRGSLRLSALAPRGTIVVETATAIGDRRQLAIVSVEGRRLLVGMTPTAISFLTDLGATPPEASVTTAGASR
jgi:flagellar protein FliO/FliZ